MPTYWRRVFKPADLEALREVADGKASPETCPLCKDVPVQSSVVEKGGRPPDPFRAHLVNVGFFERCPVSSSLYIQGNVEYEYLANGSEDTYSYERVTAERAGTLLGEWAIEGGNPRG